MASGLLASGPVASGPVAREPCGAAHGLLLAELLGISHELPLHSQGLQAELLGTSHELPLRSRVLRAAPGILGVPQTAILGAPRCW